MKNKSLIFLSLFLCGVILLLAGFSVNLAFAQDNGLYSSAKGCAVIEATTKRILFSVNPNKKMPMASTTKIMTAITAIENCDDIDEKFEISPAIT